MKLADLLREVREGKAHECVIHEGGGHAVSLPGQPRPAPKPQPAPVAPRASQPASKPQPVAKSISEAEHAERLDAIDRAYGVPVKAPKPENAHEAALAEIDRAYGVTPR